MPSSRPSNIVPQSAHDGQGVTRDSSGKSAVQILAPDILCVDDDPHVLVALRRTLCRHFCVDVAQGGLQGLELMARKRYAVVIVDMKMPGMSGPEFLRRAREEAPETTRILLTGNSDFEAAVAATNDGGIFRFICKPYNPVEFPATVADAVHHHHLLVAEQNVAQRTLAGTVDLLVQFASVLAPAVCDRLTRAQEVARSVSAASGIVHSSPLETAALVHVLACAMASGGVRLGSVARHELLGHSQRLAVRLLGGIPSASLVLDLFERARRETLDSPLAALLSPEITALLLLLEWEALIQSGSNEAAAHHVLEQREVYPRELLDALRPDAARMEAELDVAVCDLEPGWQIRSDIVVKTSGQVLLSKGAELTRPILERIRHYARSVGVVEPIRVIPNRRASGRRNRLVARGVVGSDLVADSDHVTSGTWKTK